jgi:hypothetical protein
MSGIIYQALEDIASAIAQENQEVAPVSHNYAGAHADWTLSAAEARAKVLIVSNANGAANIIAPVNRKYIVVNGAGFAVTIKVAAGSGIAIANTKTAEVFYNGTDYARLTADI